MATETSITLGPDWLRNKPVTVFGKVRKNQYDEEELINMWSVSPLCPQTINNIPDLGSSQALKPAISADDLEPFNRGSMSSDRGRGRGVARGRGGGRRQYDPNARYYEQRSTADSDNWRRRDPDPDNHQPDPMMGEGADQVMEQQSCIPEQPPSYPPFPSKTLSPIQIDNREALSWKRTEQSPAKQLNIFKVDQPPTPPSQQSPETMLRNISETLDRGNEAEAYNSHVIFPGFNEPKAGGTGMYGVSSAMEIPSSFASQIPSSSTSVAAPTVPLEMPPLFSRDTTSPETVPSFPSLAEIGKSLNEHVPEVQGQGFMPPPQPSPLPYRAADQWYYLDPKGNTQGPFDSDKMLGWFKEGYFGMDLEIKRASDHMFTKLQIMIQRWGKVPFGIEDKQSPPPGNLGSSQMMTSHDMTSPPMTRPSAVPQAWTGSNNGIWGTTDHSTNFNFPTDGDKAKRAEEMRKEIERAMEQQRHHEREEERLRIAKSETNDFLASHRHMMEDQQAKEEELRILKARKIEEESEKIRIEKERLEMERKRQAERVRIELEEAEKARKALEQERIKLEKERQLVKQKEEELRLRDEAEKRKQEIAAHLVAERQRAEEAAAEAKALVKAEEARRRALVKAEEARRMELVKEEEARRREQAEEAARREEEARKIAVWSSSGGLAQSPPAQENTNPWANIPSQNVTKAASRTAAPSTKGWGKAATSPASIPLSQIQQDEAKMKKSAPGGVKEPPAHVPRQPGWGRAPTAAPSKTPRSLAEIQREEARRSTQQTNLTQVHQSNWNPVAGMLEEDTAPPPKAKKQQIKQQQQQPSKSNKKGKSQPLLDMFPDDCPKDDFTMWCESQVSAFRNQHIDVATFTSFLREVESPREVREYVISYLGDTLSTDKFIQEFLARRKTANQGSALQLTISSPQKDSTSHLPASKRGKRKKMQKVNAASLLGINCTASSDARNRGDIDSVTTQ